MAVPIQTPPPPSYSEQAVRRMEAEHKLLADERFTGWAVIWTLFGFKMATVVIIVLLGGRNAEAGGEKWWAYMISTTWYWFFIPLIAFSGIVAWRLRLRKARKLAQQMKRSEFSILSASELEPLTEEEKARLRKIQRPTEQGR